ncbi:hypothetical protein [Amycolatopsis sp.]|uniref:hypothetical protein n=1 Tax=Amycolatopsis sp. TaxID=37632 RepID=UPI002C6BF745|nr:hypothetical protein [Amycolatopsis sp.]HVV07999.1 hypothetical protein [Amycolatopsis sp.]
MAGTPTIGELSEAGRSGQLLDLTGGDPEHREPVDPALLTEVLAGSPRALRLRGARFTANLDLGATRIGCPLSLESCVFDGITLDDAETKSISLRGSHMFGLSAQNLRAGGSLDLGAVTATMGVSLTNAHIQGNLLANDARLDDGGHIGLLAHGLVVDRDLIGEGLVTGGPVYLSSARIGGTVRLDGARLDGAGRPAISAEELSVDGSLFCAKVTATGEVSLLGARIGGDLSFDGANLSNPGGPALHADGITVGAGFSLRNGFSATGAVRLISASVGRRIVFADATLTNPESFALIADGLSVGHDLEFRPDFATDGEIRLFDARIGRQLRFSGTSAVPEGRAAFTLTSLHADSFFLTPREPFHGRVELTRAQIREIYDDERSWPPDVALLGLEYQVLQNHFVRVRDRLSWLVRGSLDGYNPSGYDQLAAAYRRTGQVEAARRVGMAKQRHRRQVLNPFGRLWNWLLYLTVGYGYRTWLAGLWLVALVALGTTLFGGAYRAELQPSAPSGPAFQPFAYTLDVLVPIVDLGQKKAWFAQGPAQVWSWTFTGAGWVLTTAVVAGVTNALKRD